MFMFPLKNLAHKELIYIDGLAPGCGYPSLKPSIWLDGMITVIYDNYFMGYTVKFLI